MFPQISKGGACGPPLGQGSVRIEDEQHGCRSERTAIEGFGFRVKVNG